MRVAVSLQAGTSHCTHVGFTSSVKLDPELPIYILVFF